MSDLLLNSAGYGIVALGFLFLFILLLTTKQKTLQRSLLLISSLLSALWSLTAALAIYPRVGQLLLPIETLRNAGWLLLIIGTLSDQKTLREFLSKDHFVRRTLPVFILLIIVEISTVTTYWLPNRYLLLIHLAQSAVGLWFIEQLYRRTDKQDRWAIKPITLGLGMTFAYDFALYANGALTNRVDGLFFLARGWVAIVTIPLITMTARRVKNWSTRIYVSREVVYSSTLLTIAGIYLLVMAIAGYYIRYLGENWGSVAQNVFFALSVLLLASLFTSESLRRKLKVFITKHFYANKYEYREEWMKFAAILEQNVNEPFQIALSAIIQPFDCDAGLLATVANDKLSNKTLYNLKQGYPEADDLLVPLAKASIEHAWIIDIKQLANGHSQDPFSYDETLAEQIETFDYVVPIINHNGNSHVCFISHPNTTHSLNWEDRDLMFAISKQLSVYLNLYLTNQILAENQQFDTFNRMSAFLAHDLKNILAQLQLLSQNAQRHRDNPEFIDDAFDTVDSAVERLSKVVEHLRKKETSTQVDKTFSVEDVIQDCCVECQTSQPQPIYHSDTTQSLTLNTDQERFRNMLIHLIQNAQEATKSDGFVQVTTALENNHYLIKIADNGSGMSEEFIEKRLFKPFDTTKGNSGMGIGAYDAKKFIEQLGGYIQVDSTLGEGSQFVLHIPFTVQTM
ncbi:PEP-CTERM system histidine kinase PrsK [Vibrio sp. CAIM 722]|uniref:histidine kinase n=1 Tax=Vibrio eleionomae TaxID=2653505 RepID=A0A7X4LPM8_9VIBR|nr:XrtA/PEP-CTERM system histidine kinase PrsK [Vibrio eleionomae]MZI95532.1 PEP-CTERM system histidine kinase PrsK [Vibrio eleionomae]